MMLDDIVSQEYGWIFAQSLRLCRNRMDAEDLAGETVLKILCNPKSYDSGRPFRPWCSVIILNTYLTRVNRDSLITFTDMENTIPAVARSDTYQRVELSEVLSAIRRCRKRSASVDCVLMYAAGFTYDEISEFYKIPAGTVRSRISYARSMIRKELGNNTLNNV